MFTYQHIYAKGGKSQNLDFSSSEEVQNIANDQLNSDYDAA